jgi:hypothetical protein
MNTVDMRTLASCFNLPENMAITSVDPSELTLIIGLSCLDPIACCPLCHQVSERVHSRYRGNRNERVIKCKVTPMIV